MRSLKKYKCKFGPYEVAAALYSYTDILQIFGKKNSPKRDILLVDVMGHDLKMGQEFKGFVEDKILKKKIGIHKDPEQELSELSRLISDYSWNPAATYVRLGEDKFLLANAGIPYPLKIRNKDGDIKEIELFGNLPLYQVTPHSSNYEDTLEKDDFLFLRTDGIDDGIDLSLGLEDCLALEGDIMKERQKEIIKERKQMLYNSLRKNRYKPAAEMLNGFIDDLGGYFIPKSEKDDDASLVIVKKYK